MEEILKECIKRFPKGSRVAEALTKNDRTLSDGYVSSMAKVKLINEIYYDGSMMKDEVIIMAIDKNGLIGVCLYWKGEFANLI